MFVHAHVQYLYIPRVKLEIKEKIVKLVNFGVIVSPSILLWGQELNMDSQATHEYERNDGENKGMDDVMSLMTLTSYY